MRVAIIMGSQSDWEIMSKASAQLAELGIESEAHVISAHRTPQRLHDFIAEAPSRSIAIYIAGAGLAAHLPGVVASLTTKPVIGVPIPGGPLKGIDALLSIVQMPPGIPVATVGLGAAKNAALLAASILATNNSEIENALKSFRHAQREKVLNAKLPA